MTRGTSLYIAVSFFIVCLFSSVRCAKILAIFPTPGYSQFILGEKLVCELTERGHNVTLISLYMPKDCAEKCRTILVDGLVDLVRGEDLFSNYGLTLFGAVRVINELGFLLTEYTLAHENVQKLIRSEETFDLVLAEKFVNEAHMAFAKHFDAPLILFSSTGPSEWTHASIGNINLPSIMPVSQAGLTSSMNFYQRFLNTLYTIFDKIYWHWVVLPKQEEFVSKYFPNNITLHDVLYNVSLLLLNSHVSTTEPTSLLTNMVEIGGFHVKQKELPPDLKTFLDSATDGAIYFSMGSNLNSTNFPKDKLEAILKVISKIKQRVVWKFENNSVDIPSNVFASKWLPQPDILGHPNVRLFISHCGLLSTTEAVYHGVPIVGIPIFGDQPMNIARAAKHGFGLRLPFESINEESFRAAIEEVLKNPSYQISALKRSQIMRDQIVKPMDKAMFWIEYVIRHRGAPHLRPPTADLYWFQIYLVDVLFSLIFILFILKNFLMKILRFNRNSGNVKRMKNKIQ